MTVSVSGNDTNMTDYYGDTWDFYSDYFGANLPEKEVAEKIYVYLSPLWLVLGTLGNILSVIVLQRLSKTITSTCLYLAVLAVVDLIVLYTRCGNDWLAQIGKVRLFTCFY